MELVVSGLSYAYGELPVLDGIGLTVGSGEVVVLIGPSGCGKSTLLGLIGGLLPVSAGSIGVRGDPPKDSLNPFTYVFQDFALLPWRSVEGNVALALEHHPIDETDRRGRVDDALALTGLSDFRSAFPKQLSGGMRQRVGIARALVVRPAILLLDEPLSALDAQTRELLMEDLESIWARERTTSIYVTHNLGEAIRLADRVVVLSRRPGRIKAVVPIDLPRESRRDRSNAPLLAALHEKLWALIKDEAQIAEREMQNG